MANPVVELGVIKTLVAWAERAQKNGLNLSVDLQPSIDDPAQMQRLVRYIKAGAPIVPWPGITYDAKAVSRILGLHVQCDDPVPRSTEGEIVIYYGGWDLPTLRGSTAGTKRMGQDRAWYYDAFEWKAEPGYYKLRLPLPHSNRLSWSDQVSCLAPTAPICVAATALLVHLTETGNDLLNGDWCRCAEIHAILKVHNGRVCFCQDLYDGGPSDRVWQATAQKT